MVLLSMPRAQGACGPDELRTWRALRAQRQANLPALPMDSIRNAGLEEPRIVKRTEDSIRIQLSGDSKAYIAGHISPDGTLSILNNLKRGNPLAHPAYYDLLAHAFPTPIRNIRMYLHKIFDFDAIKRIKKDWGDAGVALTPNQKLKDLSPAQRSILLSLVERSHIGRAAKEMGFPEPRLTRNCCG